jgi:hypothetical protein
VWAKAGQREEPDVPAIGLTREHLAAISTAGNKRVVTQRVGVAVGSTLPVVAVHLADGGVQIHGYRPVTGARPSRPRPGKELLGEPVELAAASGPARQGDPAQVAWSLPALRSGRTVAFRHCALVARPPGTTALP